jgi:hypothetical protein
LDSAAAIAAVITTAVGVAVTGAATAAAAAGITKELAAAVSLFRLAGMHLASLEMFVV